MKKHIIKTIIGIIIGFVIAVLVITLYFGYQVEWKRTTIAVYENEDAGYSVVFQEIGTAFLFGPSKVEVSLEDENGRTVDSVTDRIYNDGKTLRKGNISVSWTDIGVQITLNGEEQEDKTYTLSWQ